MQNQKKSLFILFIIPLHPPTSPLLTLQHTTQPQQQQKDLYTPSHHCLSFLNRPNNIELSSFILRQTKRRQTKCFFIFLLHFSLLNRYYLVATYTKRCVIPAYTRQKQQNVSGCFFLVYFKYFSENKKKNVFRCAESINDKQVWGVEGKQIKKESKRLSLLSD